jgi:anaerobic glycerol-3-phosphate dehydrogenase C subunit
MDAMVIDLVRGRERGMQRFLPEGTKMAYLLEFDGMDLEQVESNMVKAEEMLKSSGLAFAFVRAESKDEENHLWQVRRSASSILNRVSGNKRPTRFIEDISVPPTKLAQFLERLWKVLESHDVRVGTIGHAGDSSFHVRPLLDLKDPDDIEKMCQISEEAYTITIEMGGSISGEHGDGLLRTPFLRKQFGEIYDLFPRVKQIFDPWNILNPGKIVSQEGKGFTDNLRLGAEFKYATTESRFDDEAIREELEKCDGCGACRSFCPIFQGLSEEKGVSRSKVNLIRAVISGDLSPETMENPEFKSVMDLCYNCKRCLSECPALTNVASLCLEARRLYIEKHGSSTQDSFLGNASKIAPLGSVFAPIANLTMRLSPFRWAMQSIAGIHKDRSMPRYRFKGMPKRYRTKPTSGKRIAYFPGCYANYNDPSGEGISTVRILEHYGFEVYVPKTKCCNVAKITMGAVDSAMSDIEENISILLGLVDEGFEIVFSAPSCLLAVRSEYPEILGDERSKRLSDHCHYIFEYMANLKDRNLIDPPLLGVDMYAAYHTPCHQRALGEDRTLEILSDVPGLRISTIADKCCGIAGTFGMKRQNYDLSMRVGQQLFDELTSSGAEAVITSCGTCRLQIEQATGLKTMHPSEIYVRSLTTSD